jgi:hypothetical protein
MPPMLIVSAALLLASTSFAEAKRFRYSSSPRPATVAKPVTAQPATAKPVTATRTGGVMIFGTTAGARAQPAEDPVAAERRRAAQASPLPLPQEAVNPNARPLPVLGQGVDGARLIPANAGGVKGFSAVN